MVLESTRRFIPTQAQTAKLCESWYLQELGDGRKRTVEDIYYDTDDF